jgi:hypothetical protein
VSKSNKGERPEKSEKSENGGEWGMGYGDPDVIGVVSIL